MIKDRILDFMGIATIGHTYLANLFELVLGVDWNTLSLIITTSLSMVYLIFRILESHKNNRLRKLEIKRLRMKIGMMQEWMNEERKNMTGSNH